MKTAELRAAKTYKSITDEKFNEMRKSNNAKLIFDNLYFDHNDNCYSDMADSILKSVAKYSTGFVVDIANRFKNATYEMSAKQAWCIAYAFLKIEKEVTFVC
jgi:hypothetical protein